MAGRHRSRRSRRGNPAKRKQFVLGVITAGTLAAGGLTWHVAKP
jgi:hypothetical protein